MKIHPPLVLVCLASSLLASACIVDGIATTAVLGDDFETPPNAPETVLNGTVTDDYTGGTLAFWNASGGTITPLQAQLNPDGGYQVIFAGTEHYAGMRISVTRGSRVGMVLVHDVPRAVSVNSPRTVLELGRYLPTMGVVNDETTAITLLLTHKARSERGGLGTLSADELESAIDVVDSMIFAEGPVLELRQAVTRLLEAADGAEQAPPVFTPPDRLDEVGASLNPEFLAAVSVDYDLDGEDDKGTEKFEALLAAAAATVEFAPPCFDKTKITVVWQLDLTDGKQNQNCEVIDTFGWILPDPSDTVFLTGGVHPDHPSCADSPQDPTCLTQDEVAVVNEALGGFAPNIVELFDDGTNGDATAGDAVYSLALEMPRGLRMHYKYTFGRGGQGWTGTEEWPGNSRLLELVDENGDGVVTRYDYFADETTNKDKANQLSPARGGRGTIDFETDANGDGVADAHEGQIDTDGDCVLDTWPSPGPVAPALADPETCKE